MNCSQCQSGVIDTSGTCLFCGYKAPEWNEEPAQIPTVIHLKDDDFEQELQSIIDTAISRQTASSSSEESGELLYSPAPEESAVWETDKTDRDESAANLFVVSEDDAPDDSVAGTIDIADITGAAYADETDEADSIMDITDADDTDDVVDIEDAEYALEADSAEDIADVAYADETDDAANIDYAAADITYAPEAGSAEDIADAAYAPETVDAADIGKADISKAEDAWNFTYIANAANPEGRLIFLSRTLSGLIDLLLIVLFSGAFLCAADYFTNAPILHSINAISFATLFLMIYFLYSIVFLGANSQTVGMMATSLRVVGIIEDQPSLKRVVCRNAVFLISLFGLGIGLLAGVFSRKCLCLHDRLSETCVVRLSEKTYRKS
ncbi:MAG: RDD family protein [Acidobacteriota bacterium]|jgi:uncharacterized RDD family membrane protein YckC|nr:RDD family protein [Acidobacteriota bacterium]